MKRTRRMQVFNSDYSTNGYTRRGFVMGTFVAGVALAGSVFTGMGCSALSGGSHNTASKTAGERSQDRSSSVVIGTLATEDLLPFWVAQELGLFENAGLSVDIVVFQSATELIAGVSSASVDFAMTDIMVAASMYASGTDILMKWVTLGLTPDQGRFGIQTADPSITSCLQLADVPIGVGSNTILEYVTDHLMAAAGVPDDQIVTEELQKLPVRYQAMASGEVKAAALPGSLLALGEESGYTTIIDDTTGDNLSQSVMIERVDFALQDEGDAKVSALVEIWDDAAARINENPEYFRHILVAQANLPDEIAATYPVSSYPLATVPTNDMVDPVLAWMRKKNYLTVSLSYDETNGTFATL